MSYITHDLRANGTQRGSGRKLGARVTNSLALVKFKVIDLPNVKMTMVTSNANISKTTCGPPRSFQQI